MRALWPLLFLLTACGGKYPDANPGATGIFRSRSVSVISGNVTLGDSISGSGQVLFSDALSEPRLGASFAIDFSLAEGSSLTLVSHASPELAGGNEIRFHRQGSGPGSLIVTFTAQGESRDAKDEDGNDAFATLDAAVPLRLQLDVHNNENPAHILIWNRAAGEDFRKEAAMLNSEDGDNSPGIGSGTRWGLRLENATVTRADKSGTKYSH